MRRLVCLFVLSLALTGYSLPAEAGGGRGGSVHGMHGGGFRGGHFAHGGHFARGGHFAHGGHFRGHGGHFRSGIFIAPFVVSPFLYYPYRSYAVTPPVVYEEPQTIIYQDAEPAATNYLYYCKSSDLYYPYAKECPEGWLKVQGD